MARCKKESEKGSERDVNTTSTRRQNNYFMVEHLSKKERLHSIIFEKSVKVLSNDILQS